jgi:hypothetical protein
MKLDKRAALFLCLAAAVGTAGCGAEVGWQDYTDAGDEGDAPLGEGRDMSAEESSAVDTGAADPVPDDAGESMIDAAEQPADGSDVSSPEAPPEQQEGGPCALHLRGCLDDDYEGIPAVEFCPPGYNVCGRNNNNACCPTGFHPVQCIDCGIGSSHWAVHIEVDGVWVGCRGGENPDNGGRECSAVVCEREGCVETEQCDNLIDDDLDGLTDCLDPDCSMGPACAEENCNNGIDEDNDGRTDCDDPECARLLPCTG